MKTIILFILISSSSTLYAQTNWNNYIGLYFSGDGEMYYTGLSGQIGAEFHLKKHISISPYLHYFNRDKGDHSFQVFTAATLIQKNIGKRKRFYVAAGLAFQRAIEEDDLYTDTIDRSIFLPAYRFGYIIPIKNLRICPEISLTGPYKQRFSMELFTFPSIGMRAYFKK